MIKSEYSFYVTVERSSEKGMCPVPLRKMIALAASSVLLCAVLITIRGISHEPADMTSAGTEPFAADPVLYSGSMRNVSLNIEVSMDDASFAVLQTLNRTVLYRLPGISVKLVNRPAAGREEHLMHVFRMEESPDLILLDNADIITYAVRAYLLPMNDFFTSNTETAYVSAMTQQLSWNGYIWGIPFQLQPYILVYHKQAWMEATGEESPKNFGQIWDAYRSGILRIDGDDLNGYAALANAMYADWQYPERLSAESGEEETGGNDAEDGSAPSAEEEGEGRTRPGETASDEEVGSEDDLDETSPIAEDIVKDNEEGGKPEHPWDLLRKGEIAALITTMHAYELNRSAGLSYSVIPTAHRDGSLFMTGESFVLAADTMNHDAAFSWVSELIQEYNRVFREQSLGAYPAVKMAYADNDDGALPFAALKTAIEKGKSMAPDLYLRRKLPLIRDQLVSAKEEDLEADEVVRLWYRLFEAHGLLNPS